MARSKSDISNSAIRVFLQEVGKFYDEARKLKPFVPSVPQKNELLEKFLNQCCYCGTPITSKSISLDHLIPMNKKSLGLHAWGNVVPCCRDCNNEKQQKNWGAFLETKASGDTLTKRKLNIEQFVCEKGYDPNLNIQEYAGNLYEDVGEVAMTLINLRYKQAQAGIQQLLHPKTK